MVTVTLFLDSLFMKKKGKKPKIEEEDKKKG